MLTCKPKKILIWGYFGFGNFGDEAILGALLRSLKKELAHVEPVVLSHDPRGTQRMHQVGAINRWNPFRVFWAFRASDAFVGGGGGLLQDRTSRRSLLYYLTLIYLAHILKKPAFLAGQGIGPLRSRFLRKLTARCLSHAEYIMVRDETSRNLLGELKIKTPVSLGEDLALAYPIPFTTSQVSKFTTHPACGISLKGDLSRRLIKPLAAFLDEICLRLKLKALFVPLFPKQDLRPAEALAEAMRGDAIVIDTNALNPAEAIDLIASCWLLLASRLHALVFALMTGVPFAAISSDPKIDAFVRKLESCTGLRVPLVQLNSLEILMREIEELWAKREQYRLAFGEGAQMLRASAERGLEELCQRMAPFFKDPKRGDL